MCAVCAQVSVDIHHIEVQRDFQGSSMQHVDQPNLHEVIGKRNEFFTGYPLLGIQLKELAKKLIYSLFEGSEV